MEAAAKADQLLRLLNHFLELCAEHIHVPSFLRSQGECNAKPRSRYSLTTSICLSSTSPVKRSIATCTQ